jgi:hypothetical protein
LCESNINNIEYLPSLGCSDHVILLFDFLCEFKELYTGNGFYMYQKCDLLGFSNEWQQLDWILLFENCNIHEMWAIFSNKFYECVNKYVPVSKPKKGFKPKPLKFG